MNDLSERGRRPGGKGGKCDEAFRMVIRRDTRMQDDRMVDCQSAAFQNAESKEASRQADRAVGMLPVIAMMVKTDRHKGDQTDNDSKKRRFLMM